MKILSIETSCDDTGVTIFEAKGGARNASFCILAHVVSTQDIHAEYGGVFPSMAKREHIRNLPVLTELMLKKAKLSGTAKAGLRHEGRRKKSPVDAIIVTQGPGLEPCLWSGIVFAQELAKKWSDGEKKVPVIPVNHMEGHAVSVFARPKGKFNITLPKSKFPMLALLVSGGHTELVLWEDIGKFKILGRTLDDAAGEAYDKVARMLGLTYPGGPKISKLAEEARKDLKGKPKKLGLRIALPRPMLHSKNLEFSFSGLKTAVLYAIRDMGKLTEQKKKKVALEFESAVAEVLVHKLAKAEEKYSPKAIILAGGVAANKFLRMEIKKFFKGKTILLPDKTLTGDNALMTGVAGYLEYLKDKKKSISAGGISAKGNLSL